MEEATLICMPVKGTVAENVVEDSLIKPCSKCGTDVWATKASIIHSGGATLICMNCFFQKVVHQTEGKSDFIDCIIRPSKGQIREIKDHFRDKPL